MRRLWDSDRPERAGSPEAFWLEQLAGLDTPENGDAAGDGSVEDWAMESLLAARAAYQVPESGVRLKAGQERGDRYVEANLLVARLRLYHASARLAMALNEAFAEK